MDVNLLLLPPSFEQRSILTVDPLAPLSMVVQMPGKFYRSQSSPTTDMLYGLLENALGWHLGPSDRKTILAKITKASKPSQTERKSPVGFSSILQYHVQFEASDTSMAADCMRFTDYWSQHLRTAGQEFLGGSREHDRRAIALGNANAAKIITFTDSGGIRDADIVDTFKEGDKINYAAIRQYFPRYYVTPTVREYVIPRLPFRYIMRTSADLTQGIAEALINPSAPLYVGSNDGWVEASLLPLISDHDQT